MSTSLLLALADLCETAHPATDYFRVHSLDTHAVTMATDGVFTSPIRIVPPRFFEPAPDGKLAAWCEVRNEFGTTIDLVAWSVRNPSKVVTLMGRAAVLGAEAAYDPISYLDGGPLRIFRNPLNWLKAGCGGVAVIDLARTTRFLLDVPASHIAAEDDAHAREIAEVRRALVAGQSIVVPERDIEPLREAA